MTSRVPDVRRGDFLTDGESLGTVQKTIHKVKGNVQVDELVSRRFGFIRRKRAPIFVTPNVPVLKGIFSGMVT